MKTSKALGMTVATLILGAAFAAPASAQCGYLDAARGPLSFASAGVGAQRTAAVGSAPVLHASEHDGDSGPEAITGLWKVTFVAKGNPDIPDGAVIDAGFAQWHADGLEILNSSRPPATSNFCLGVWKNVGRARYKLNHFALSSDLGGNLIGPANIREDVSLSRDGDAYVGSFTIDQFDQTGSVLAHVAGEVSATRITVDTPAASLF